MMVVLEDPQPPPVKQRSQWLFIAMGAAMAAIVAISVMTVDAVRYRAAERREDCERSVQTRDDARTIWLELFEMFPDSEEGQRLHVILDARLPPLHCEGATPIPVPVES